MCYQFTYTLAGNTSNFDIRNPKLQNKTFLHTSKDLE
jgi:hypothetical protein